MSVICAVHILYLFAAFMLFWRLHAGTGLAPRSARLLFSVILIGLSYENLALTTGAFLPVGDLLASLNAPRFVAHAFLLPLLIPAAALLAAYAGVTAFRRSSVQVLLLGIVALLLLYGLYELRSIQLVALPYDGCQRYVASPTLPPITAITTTLITLLIGLAIWRATAYPWIALSTLLLLLTGGSFALMPRALLPLLTNAMELLLLWSLVACGRRLANRASSMNDESAGVLNEQEARDDRAILVATATGRNNRTGPLAH